MISLITNPIEINKRTAIPIVNTTLKINHPSNLNTKLRKNKAIAIKKI